MSFQKVLASQPDRRAGVELRVLGPLSLNLHGHDVPLHSARLQKLTAVLAIGRGTIVSWDRIVDTLWDAPPKSARQQVHNVASVLRRAMAPARKEEFSLETSTTGYRLRIAAGAFDLARFEENLRQSAEAETRGADRDAVRLLELALWEWRGQPFGGLQGAFLDASARALVEARLGALERLVALQIRRGGSLPLVGRLVELVGEHPYRESLRVALIRTLAANGRQADALEVFEEGRRLLADELGLDPGEELRSAHQDVLRGETGVAAGRQPDHPDVAAAAGPAPEHAGDRSFLPRDIAEFTGRRAEIDRLLEFARGTSGQALVISAINGMGGAGKTALAVHLAHRLIDEYPAGHYFIDLLGFSAVAEPLTPLQAVGQLLRSTGFRPELVPSTLPECTALWRSHLAGQRVLLLLDNAVDEAQVRPLLPGVHGPLVLISSRRRLAALEGSVPLSVDVMPLDDAVELFTRIVGPARVEGQSERLAEVARHCGQLPLAIQIAAARLRDRPSWTVSYLARQLADHTERARLLATGDRDVMHVLSWSYRHLRPDQQRMFRLLAVHPGPDFDVCTAAALAGCPPGDAKACLEELLDVNLLKQDSYDRYYMHDLIGDCARGLLESHSSERERSDAKLRLLDYYLRSTNTWCDPLAKDFYRITPVVAVEPPAVHMVASVRSAVDLIEREYRNIVAVIKTAYDGGFHAHVWQIVCSLLAYFGRTNYGGDTEFLLSRSIESARRDGSNRGAALSLMGLSYATHARGHSAEARELMASAVGISEAAGDVSGLVYQQLGLGMLSLEDGLLSESLTLFSTALKLSRELADTFAEAALLNNLGVTSRGMGDLDGALVCYHSALSLSESSGERHVSIKRVLNIGEVHKFRLEYEEAAKWYERGLDLSAEITDDQARALSYLGMSSVARARRDFDESLRLARAALDFAKSSGRRDTECDAYNVIADTYTCLADYDTAEAVLNQARTAAAQFGAGARLLTARVDEGAAHVLLARGDVHEARKHFESALAAGLSGVLFTQAVERHLAAEIAADEFCWRCAFQPSAI